MDGDDSDLETSNQGDEDPMSVDLPAHTVEDLLSAPEPAPSSPSPCYRLFRIPYSRLYLRHFMVAKVILELQFPRFYLILSFARREQRSLWVYIARWKII